MDLKTINELEKAYLSVTITPIASEDSEIATVVQKFVLSQWKEIFRLAKIGIEHDPQIPA